MSRKLSYKLKNTKIFEVTKCIICLENNTNSIFLPCGHKCTCYNCSNKLRKMKILTYYGFSNTLQTCSYIPKCPLCRRKIDDYIDVTS